MICLSKPPIARIKIMEITALIGMVTLPLRVVSQGFVSLMAGRFLIILVFLMTIDRTKNGLEE